MLSFLATIFSIKFLVENWQVVLAVLVALIIIIIMISRSRKKKRAAYLALPVLYYGNRSTCTYHTTRCSKLEDVNPVNLVAFRHPDEVKRAGYKPCGICKP